MIISKAWIHAHTTAGGAWNRKQIEALGLKWPQTKGWIKGLAGTEITDKQKAEFERYAYADNAPEMTLAMRVEELEKEFKEQKRYMAMILNASR